MTITEQVAELAQPISAQLHNLPPVPDDKTAVAMFTAHRVNDMLTALAHAQERMQVMRGAGGELRHYHGLHFDNHVMIVLDNASQLKDSMLAHYPAEAGEWRALVTVMNLATGYDLNKRSGMISLDLPPGTVAPVPDGVTDHHITVVYLGPDVDDAAFAQACDRARKAASAMPGPLTGSVGGIGTFQPKEGGDKEMPAWAGVVLPGAERLRSALEDLSASEFKDWKPHVTLAFVKPSEALPQPVPHTPVTFTHLAVHRGEDEVVRFPLGGGPAQLSSAVALAKAVDPAAKAASFAHLLQTIMYDAAHAERHSKAMLADETDPEWDFDADHAEKHLKGTREHVLKLAEHIRDNYPAEAHWLDELVHAEELSSITGQVAELGWQDQLRDPRGRWTTSGGLLSGHVHPEGFSLDPRTGNSPRGGFMVALPGHTHQYPDSVIEDEHHLAEAIDQTLMSERDIFKQPGVYLGGWVSDGKLWLDPSENVVDKDQALKLGRSRDQVAIWDVQGGQEIGTGGSGGAVTEHATPSVHEDPGRLRGLARAGAQSRGPSAGQAVATGTISAQIGITGTRL